ncbi:MAG: hypothetical protein CMO81_09160 [Waddliaceae bacterium]|nr:hypothetical protein [Waddliaceae bacterium]
MDKEINKIQFAINQQNGGNANKGHPGFGKRKETKKNPVASHMDIQDTFEHIEVEEDKLDAGTYGRNPKSKKWEKPPLKRPPFKDQTLK